MKGWALSGTLKILVRYLTLRHGTAKSAHAIVLKNFSGVFQLNSGGGFFFFFSISIRDILILGILGKKTAKKAKIATTLLNRVIYSPNPALKQA